MNIDFLSHLELTEFFSSLQWFGLRCVCFLKINFIHAIFTVCHVSLVHEHHAIKNYYLSCTRLLVAFTVEQQVVLQINFDAPVCGCLDYSLFNFHPLKTVFLEFFSISFSGQKQCYLTICELVAISTEFTSTQNSFSISVGLIFILCLLWHNGILLIRSSIDLSARISYCVYMCVCVHVCWGQIMRWRKCLSLTSLPFSIYICLSLSYIHVELWEGNERDHLSNQQ